jgi:hypothetical protein
MQHHQEEEGGFEVSSESRQSEEGIISDIRPDSE